MLEKEFLDVGMGSYVLKENVIAILESNSSSAKRYWRAAKESSLALDFTRGRKAHSVIVMKDGYIGLSVLVPGTTVRRLEKSTKELIGGAIG